MQVTVETLRALRDKYREIKRLRDEHARGLSGAPALCGGAGEVDHGRVPPPPPRIAMAALARRFPGALRELDELPMPMIEERLGLLDAALERGALPPDWAHLQIAYHGLMRATLRIKRMLVARGDAAGMLTAIAAAYVPAPDEPPLSSFDAAAVIAIARPSGGRLNPWVFEKVAAACGVEVDTVRRALFLR